MKLAVRSLLLFGLPACLLAFLGCNDTPSNSSESTGSGGSGAFGGGSSVGSGGAAGGTSDSDDDDVVGAPWDGTFPSAPKLLVGDAVHWLLLADDTIVYRVEGGDVLAVPKTGGTPELILNTLDWSLATSNMLRVGTAAVFYAEDPNDSTVAELRGWSATSSLVTFQVPVEPGGVLMEAVTTTDGAGAVVSLEENPGSFVDTYWLDIASMVMTHLGRHQAATFDNNLDCWPAATEVFCTRKGDLDTELWRVSGGTKTIVASFSGGGYVGIFHLTETEVLLNTPGGVVRVPKAGGDPELIAPNKEGAMHQGDWLVTWEGATLAASRIDGTEAWTIADGVTDPRQFRDRSLTPRFRLVPYCDSALYVANVATREVTKLSDTCQDVWSMSFSDKQVVTGTEPYRSIIDVETLQSVDVPNALAQFPPWVVPIRQSQMTTFSTSASGTGAHYYDGNNTAGLAPVPFPEPIFYQHSSAITADTHEYVIGHQRTNTDGLIDIYSLERP